MTRKVRSLTPLMVLAGSAMFWLAATNAGFAQEKQAETKNDVSAETKAQVLQDLDRQLDQKRAEMTREEERLAATKAALEAVKKDLKQELDRLEAIKTEVEAQIARRDKVVNERLSSIAKIYQSMKPKEAATALQQMDDDMAEAILERLPQRTVAKIFDTMPKERVRELTRRLEEGRSK